MGITVFPATMNPVPVNAYQWFPELGTTPGVAVLKQDPDSKFPPFYYCTTLVGPARILPGSWVISHPELGFYMLDPEIFHARYTLDEAETGTEADEPREEMIPTDDPPSAA